MYQLDEKTGLITLTLTRDDFEKVLIMLGLAAGSMISNPTQLEETLGLLNRLNDGNPNYTPYQVGWAPRPEEESHGEPRIA